MNIVGALPRRGNWQNPVDSPLFYCYTEFKIGGIMSVKIALIKTGQFVIADVQEMIVDDRLAGFYFYKPCLVNIIDPETEQNPQGPTQLTPGKTSFNISLFPWIPLAKGTRVPVVSDWVVTFTDPVDMLAEMYENDVINSTRDWNEGMNHPPEESAAKEDDNYDCKTCR